MDATFKDLDIEKRKYVLTGITRILGAQPANPDVRSAYIASKAKTLQKSEEENARLPERSEEDIERLNLTVFLREDGALAISDYVIKGFLKEAMAAVKGKTGVASPASKIDNLTLVRPAYLRFTHGSIPVTEPEEIVQRPLRAQTMQGPRNTVTASECIGPGWQLEFELLLLDNAETKRSAALTFEAIEQALSYGAFKGLGQWRNGQNGRFTWERTA